MSVCEAFYFTLRQDIGNSGDHGIRSSSENVLSFFCKTLLGNSVRRYSKYWYSFKLFALAVSAMLYATALAWAPATVSITFQFFLPTQNGRIARSHAELLIGISPVSRNALRYFPRLIL